MAHNEGESLFAIKFAIALSFLIAIPCLCLCLSLCGKESNKSSKKFEVVKYKDKYERDSAELKKLVPNQNKGGNVLNSLIQSDSGRKDGATIKKNYLCFTFDNLTPMLKASSAFQDDDKVDPYNGLNDFVNIVIQTCTAEETEIILIIASPGGYAFKFEKSYSDLMRLRSYGFVITAVVDSICASGGYMLACGCNRILSSPYAQLGSVGVIAKIHNYSKLIEKIGIEEKTFATGKYKAGFPQGTPYTEEDVAITKELIDDTFCVFKKIVNTARNQANMDELLTARVWYGQEAFDRKIVDELILTSDDYLSNLSKNHEVLLFNFPTKGTGLASMLGNLTQFSSIGVPVVRYLNALYYSMKLKESKPMELIDV